jgi:undecaprenyl diphosphate synthase
MDTPIRSIGVIMDGNRRFAKAHGLSTKEGHEAGYRTLKKIADEFPRLKEEYGLEFITLYAFSTENWKRAPEEVAHLLDLFERGMREMGRELKERNIRIQSIGDTARFPKHMQEMLNTIEEESQAMTSGTVAFALSYGGRAEIVDAVNRAVKDGREVTEEEFEKMLWTGPRANSTEIGTGVHIPDPDLIIRTSGEQRLSNFLPWQSVYSELFFTETLWPDFTVEELEKIFIEYRTRERRHGK